MTNFPPIGTQVIVLAWATRKLSFDVYEKNRRIWQRMTDYDIAVPATVTGVVTRYDGDHVSQSGYGEDYEQGYLKNRKAVRLLGVRITPTSRERLAWSWYVV